MSPKSILKNEMLAFIYSQKKRHGKTTKESIDTIHSIITEIESEVKI